MLIVAFCTLKLKHTNSQIKKAKFFMIEKIYMNFPTFYDLKYNINPWMSKNKKPNLDLAQKQWLSLYHTIKNWEIKLEVLENYLSPDSVFIADSGIIYGNKFVLSNFKFAERKEETKGWQQYFSKNYKVIDVSSYGCYEGSGDSFIIKDFFICGYGYRTCESVAKKIGDILELQSILLELVDNNFFHLDTCLAFLDTENLIFYPPAISYLSKKYLENNFNCFDIPKEEAFMFGCNLVQHKKNLILQQGCNKIADIARKLDFQVYFQNLSEFIKAGGGAKCLTLKNN